MVSNCIWFISFFRASELVLSSGNIEVHSVQALFSWYMLKMKRQLFVFFPLKQTENSFPFLIQNSGICVTLTLV